LAFAGSTAFTAAAAGGGAAAGDFFPVACLASVARVRVREKTDSEVLGETNPP